MRGAAIILTGLLLTAACTEPTEPAELADGARVETATFEWSDPPSPRPAADAAPASPAKSEPEPVYPVPAGTPCDVRGGWSEDTDPRGLNIRSRPALNATVVGTLPPPKYIEEMERVMRTGFDIIETRDGWFHIANAYPNDMIDPKRPPLPAGWIHGRFVSFALQTDKAFVAPDPRSEVVATSWDSPDGIRQFSYRQPMECRGRWMRLLVTDMHRREREAWVRGICNGQETTCDGGADGDYFEAGETMPRGP